MLTLSECLEQFAYLIKDSAVREDGKVLAGQLCGHDLWLDRPAAIAVAIYRKQLESCQVRNVELVDRLYGQAS